MAEDKKHQAPKQDTVTLTIDGQQTMVPKGTTVLEAARGLGIDIPTFCWHPKLKSVGACRMCYVEIEKMAKLQVSCATEAVDGMVAMFDKMIKTTDWLEFADKSGLATDGRHGQEFVDFIKGFEETHIEIMKAQGWIK